MSTTKAAPPSQRGAAKVASGQTDVFSLDEVEARFTVWERHRQRQVARLATVAQVAASYGVEARELPPGPATCPRTCPWCAHLELVS
jgi:hypothetical protein